MSLPLFVTREVTMERQRPTTVELFAGTSAARTFEDPRCLWLADDLLRRLAVAAPRRSTGEAVKIDFRVTFGELADPYIGTFELNYEHMFVFDRGLLATHIQDFLTFMANERRPDHMTEDEWAAAQDEHIRLGWKAMAQAMLAAIDLSRDAPRRYK